MNDARSRFLAAIKHAKASPEIKHLKVKDIEAKAELSHGYLRTLERGERVPRLDVVQRLADVLGIEIDFYHAGPDAVLFKPTPNGDKGYDVYVQGEHLAQVREGTVQYRGAFLYDRARIATDTENELEIQPSNNTALQQLPSILQQQVDEGRKAQLLLKHLYPQSESTSCK